MSLPRRVLCGAADIKGWSRRLVPEQIRAQQSLVAVVHAAFREAGLNEEIVQSSGDGVLIMPPSDIDETTVIPDLIRGLSTALRQENRLLSEAARIRLRFALTSGMVAPGPAGFSGGAVIECFRLLDSKPAKAALEDFPHAQLAVIVSDYLFQDVVRHGFRDLEASGFWPVQSSIPDKGFTANAWVWVSDRTGGSASSVAEPQPAEAPAPHLPGEIARARTLADQGEPQTALKLLDTVTATGTAENLAVLDVRADCLIALGEFQQAIIALEEMLRLQPDPAQAPSPYALLRLGRCHQRLGDPQVARHTFTYLISHQPLEAEAYLELGRLERLAGRYATAKRYLVEGLRLVRSAPETDAELLDALVQELAELPATDQ